MFVRSYTNLFLEICKILSQLIALTNHLANRGSQRISMSEKGSHFCCKYCVTSFQFYFWNSLVTWKVKICKSLATVFHNNILCYLFTVWKQIIGSPMQIVYETKSLPTGNNSRLGNRTPFPHNFEVFANVNKRLIHSKWLK